jgi:GNAT superfamily N-acetyltransferase
MDVEIRLAVASEAEAVGALAAMLAQSFPFSKAAFDQSYPSLLADTNACVLVASLTTDLNADIVGYLLGFRHETFFAGGPVAFVEEILVRDDLRGFGVGRSLMAAFEAWALDHRCVLVSLSTRRAAPFYRALGYEESASYLRKILP